MKSFLTIIFFFASIICSAQSSSSNYKSTVRGHFSSGVLASSSHSQMIGNNHTSSSIYSSSTYSGKSYIGFIANKGNIGIGELENFELLVFPNPSSKFLHLKLSQGIEIEDISLIDEQGKEHGLILASDNPYLYDLSILSSGTYWLVVETSKGVSIKKIFKI